MRDAKGRFIKGYCSSPMTQFKVTLSDKNCMGCGVKFHPKSFLVKYHNRECSSKNRIAWNKGKHTGIRPWLGKKRPDISSANSSTWKGGKPNCKICSKKLARRGSTYCQNCANKIYHSGENNINWRGGVTSQNERERKSPAYRRWHRAVLKRDNDQCIWCENKDNLEVDHIKQFAFYPSLRTEISNGRTLCLSCHQKTFVFVSNQYINNQKLL